MTDPIMELILSDENKRLAMQNDNEETESTDDIEEESEDKEEYNTEQEYEDLGMEVPNFNSTEDDDFIRFIEERDVTLKAGVWNTIESNDDFDKLHQLPFKGTGKLENFVVIAKDSDFDIRVEIDNHSIIDDSYSFISNIQNELSKISAYSKNNNYVVSVMNYEFEEWFNAQIRPNNQDIDFTIIRIEIERGLDE